MKFYQRFSLLIIMFSILTISCAQNIKQDKESIPGKELKQDAIKYKVTFIELGSARCVPCRQMQPVMKSIEEKYGSQVKVVFYDVWTPLGKPMADKYNIQLIPTQVFLDENGKEYFRHEGFFPEVELVQVLRSKSVK